MDKTIELIINSNIPLLIEGPTGVGKTYIIQELANRSNKRLVKINASGELTVDSIIGHNTLITDPKSQQTIIAWSDGVLTTALKNGWWVLMDELNTALPEVLTVINGVLDDSRSITLPDDQNTVITAHKDFRFIGTQNPSTSDYLGTNKLNDALLNRMVKVEMGYMDGSKEFDILQEELKANKAKATTTELMGLIKMAQYTRDNKDFPAISTRDLVHMVRLAKNMTLGEAIELKLKSRMTDDQYNNIKRNFSDVINYILNESNDAPDIIHYIEDQLSQIKQAKRELEREKLTYKDEIKKSIFENILSQAKEVE